MSIPNLDVFSSSSQSEDDSRNGLRSVLHRRSGDQYDTEDSAGYAYHDEEMTEEERNRAEQRKENNKLAAKKSREKKRQKLDSLEKRARELRLQREHLLKEKKRLNEEREKLKNILRHHADTCPGALERIQRTLAIY